MPGDFLFSVDVEDVREWVPDGHTYRDRVEPNMDVYLDFLGQRNIKGTFFVVGSLARKKPDLIKKIFNAGHELALHSDNHLQLDKLGEDHFEEDLCENILALQNCGVHEIRGFRAPTFSLTQKTKWVYPILCKHGISYSSSVLPAKNPLYGWEDFGIHPKIIEGVMEIPITINPLPFPKTPLFGGVYARVLPFILISQGIKKIYQKKLPLLTYMHPYDIDIEQEKFMHPDINNSRFYNFLMFYNRKNLLKRIDRILNTFNPNCQTYYDYVQSVKSN